MKSIKRSLKFVLILILFTNLQAQQTTEFNQTTRLAALAKLWGFLKYHHPKVATGKIDWDEVLVYSIPKIKEAYSREIFNEEIGRIIKKAGNVNFLNFKEITFNYIIQDPLYAWMKDETHFYWNNTLKLEILIKNFKSLDNFYVHIVPYTRNTSYTQEKPYETMTFPSEEYRLLALFRYWNIINYFFPYKYVIGSDWNDILYEFIPKLINAGNATEYHLSIRELTARINDSHAFTNSSVLSEYWGEYFPPFHVRFIENQTVVTYVRTHLLNSPDDIEVGDIITKANGVSVKSIRKEMRKYMGASNEPTRQRFLNGHIFTGQNDQLKLTILRNSEEKIIDIKRYTYDDLRSASPTENKEIWKILENNIGYVNMGILEAEHVHNAMRELTDTKAIIFDIRNYPEFILYKISEYLNPERVDFVKFSKPDPKKPGRFEFTYNLKTGPQGQNDYYYRGKVILLINEETQSRAEFTCMALQTAPDATIIGSQTAGADGNVSHVMLPGGIKTHFSGIGVFYPDGTETQRIGIVPDIEIKPTIKGIREGRDEVLEKALEFINKSTN